MTRLIPFHVGAIRMMQEIEEFRAGVYRHYKGAYYLVLGLARADETNEIVVVYTRLYSRDGLLLSTRLLRIWNQEVESATGWVPRFVYVGHATPGEHVAEGI